MRRLIQLVPRTTLLDGLILALAVALPCRQLAALDSDFYIDWSNHQWSIAYTAEFFRHHWTMPRVFNTPELGGMAVPVFYGNLFYPAMGFLARWTSPALAIRIAAVALCTVEVCSVTAALRCVGASRWLSLAVACLVIWAIYPLTNLYNRGALTEWFATGLLVCALASVVLLCRAGDARARLRHACAALLALTISAGSHPITAMLGIPTFTAIGAVFWWSLRGDAVRRRAIGAALLPWLGLAALCMAPWFYATVNYASELQIHGVVTEAIFFPDSIDAWSTRFWPFPRDPRVAPGVAPGTVSTPYLDAQINLALLILLVALAVIAIRSTRGAAARKPLAAMLAVVVALFGVFTAMSLVPATYHLMPTLGPLIQFAYRAVTYQNLVLLVGVFLVVMATPAGRPPFDGSVVRAVTAACLALSLVAMVAKWQHISVIQHPGDASTDPVHLPPSYYGAGGYATERLFTPLGDAAALDRPITIDGGRRFGLASTQVVDLAEPAWLATNVQSFPWNAILVDDARLAPADLRTANGRIVARMPAGRHRMTTRFEPPIVWSILRIASLLGLACWWIALITQLAIALAVWLRRTRQVV